MTHRAVHEWGRVDIGDAGFTRGQADELLSAARAHPLGGIDGTEILCDHHRFLRARQMVGVLAGRGCSLEILPKVDPLATDEGAATVRARLVHMLDAALELNLSAGEATTIAHRAESLLEVFISIFADRLLEEVRRGLPRQYRRLEDDLRALRGQLNVVRQFTVHAVRPDKLACRFDELHADTPLMQVMKSCVVLLAQYARTVSTQRKLAELRFLLADVSDISFGALPWSHVRIDRTSRRWKVLLQLARLLLGGRWQQTHADARAPAGITLLFPMNDLFEKYVSVQLRRALAGSGLDVVAQGGLRYCLGPWREGQECVGDSHSTRPDILIRRGDEALAIIDTKWKDLGKGVSQPDVYQMMAYARLYRCPRLILLYPTVHGDDAAQYPPRGLTYGRERLDVAGLKLTTTSASVQNELRNLLRSCSLGTHLSDYDRLTAAA